MTLIGLAIAAIGVCICVLNAAVVVALIVTAPPAHEVDDVGFVLDPQRSACLCKQCRNGRFADPDHSHNGGM